MKQIFKNYNKKINKVLFDYSESDDNFVQITLPTTIQVRDRSSV